MVVDDEQAAIDILQSYIEITPFLKLVNSTNNPIEALQALQVQPVDLIFLDVQMPQLSGLDFMKIVQGKNKVILTTAYSTHAVEGFEQDAIDYLLKPISFQRFLRASQKALNTVGFTAPGWRMPQQEEADYIFVKTENKGKMIKINFSEIRYVEGLKNYVSIYTKDERIITLLNIKDLEERLPQNRFMRVHKSYIVALNQIRAVDGNQIFLKDLNAYVALGETYRSGFFKTLNNHVVGGKR